MIVELYLVFWVLAVSTAAASLFFKTDRGEILALPFISFLFFSILAVSSYDITRVYCDMNATSTWSCYVAHSQEMYTGYLAGGLGLLILAIGIYFAITEPMKTMSTTGFTE
jgi:hypothetical protein